MEVRTPRPAVKNEGPTVADLLPTRRPGDTINLVTLEDTRESIFAKRLEISDVTKQPEQAPPPERTPRQQSKLELEQNAGRRAVETARARPAAEGVPSAAEVKANGSAVPVYRPPDGAGSKDREASKAR